jgi:DNA-binding GntR family transcriptional regulator
MGYNGIIVDKIYNIRIGQYLTPILYHNTIELLTIQELVDRNMVQNLPINQSGDRQSLADQVTNKLRDMFLNGDLIPGQRLIETDIAEQLNVSRGPIRDALKALQEEGIVHIEPRRGTFIAKLCLEDLDDIYLLRGAIEGLGARILAEEGTPEQIDHLHACLINLHNSIHDLKKFAQYDLQFHELLCQLSGHKWLYKQWVSMKTYIWLFIQSSQALDSPGDPGMLDSHTEIFQAIQYRLPSLAEQAARRHSVLAGEEIRLLWEQDPENIKLPPFIKHHIEEITSEDCQ